METPKPPASSQLRRPSTSPYTRRKRAGTVRDEGEGTLDGSAPTTELAVAKAVAAAVNAAIATAAPPAPAAKGPKPRTRAKTQPATPKALAGALVAEPAAPSSESSLASSLAAPLPPLDASLDVLEGLLDSIEASTAVVSFSASISASFATSTAGAPAFAQISEPPALTELPSPRQLPTGASTEPAPPPGLVPRGDSRSLRRGEMFALVYRVHCFVVTRHGRLGQLGHWSAVEYPTPSAASHAYARGCSHWASEGFSDYRR